MEIYVLNQALDRIGVVDIYESFIWNPSYNRGGSFGLCCPMSYFELLQTDRIIQCTEDDFHNGLIENTNKVTDDEGNESLKVKGRMLEAVLERRMALGDNVFESMEPAEMIHALANKHIINPEDSARALPNFRVEGNPMADEGVTSYQVENKHMLSAIQSLAEGAQLGFSVYADDAQKKFVLNLYKGVNRTEEDNTETDVTEETAVSLLTNGDFSAGLTGWNVQNNERAFDFRDQEYLGPYPMIVSEGIASKSKVCSIGDDGSLFDIWNTSPHAYQSVSLDSEHIYYLVVNVSNQTDSVCGFGFQNKGACILNVGRTPGYTNAAAVFVPESSGQHTFYMGLGDLSDREGQYVYMDYAAAIDLTATFGVGCEPDLDYCKKNIYKSVSGAWKYKKQTISFIENANNPLVFSRDRDTLIDMEYSKITVNERNVVYVAGDTLGTVITNGSPSGLNRKETFLNLSGLKRTIDGVELPEASYIAMLNREGSAVLRKMTVSEIVDGKYYLLSDKKYRQDFDLGDLVNCVDRIGFEATLRISETTEVWDATGYSLAITLGDDVPDIYETIKLVSKGAK